LIGLTLVPLYALGYYELLSFRDYSVALPIIGTIFLTVVFEEAVFRGIIFRLLEQYAGAVKALVVQALLFGVLHLFNDGPSELTLISVTLQRSRCYVGRFALGRVGLGKWLLST
jgi:membrane protease YdiL (CAAX protease family)